FIPLLPISTLFPYTTLFRSNDFDSHEIASSNFVNGRPLRYYHGCGPLSLDGQPTGQLLVSNCTGFRASNLTIGQTDVAVELAYVDRKSTRLNSSHVAISYAV